MATVPYDTNFTTGPASAVVDGSRMGNLQLKIHGLVIPANGALLCHQLYRVKILGLLIYDHGCLDYGRSKLYGIGCRG
jgi:hypothetical protein